MVAFNILMTGESQGTMTEEKQRTVPESSVLSRVRMLERNDNRGADTPPLLPSRNGVHVYHRRSEQGAQQQNLERDSSDSYDKSEGRETLFTVGTIGNAEPDQLKHGAPNTHDTFAQSTQEHGLSFSARRESLTRDKEPKGAYKPYKALTTNDTRLANSSPKGDPLGFRGTLPVTNKRALSESPPQRQISKAVSPSHGPPTASSSITKKFDNLEKASIPLFQNDAEPDNPASGQRKASFTPHGDSREEARDQLAATHFTVLRKSILDNRNSGTEQQLVRPVASLPSAVRPKKEGLVVEDDRVKKGLSGEAKFVSLRKVEEFTSLVKYPNKSKAPPLHTSSEDALTTKNDRPVLPRAPSPLTNLQRHHWDKKNESIAKQDAPNDTGVAAGRKSLPSKTALPVHTGGVVELDWPIASLKASNFSKDGSSASYLLQGKQNNVALGRGNPAGPKFPVVTAKASTSNISSHALRQNLHDASTVMIDEKASNGGTSTSSSGRSTLSQKELGGIASKALKLYQTRIDTQATRNQNSILHQMLTEKRTAAKPIVKTNVQGRKPETQSTTDAFAYSSAARLSERLTRAERFSALKESRIKSRMLSEDGSMFSTDTSISPVKKSTHPVFGYTNRDLTINLQDDASVAPSEPSCIRRSKHLSKVMQQKADHFASASPTRRMKNATGYRNHQGMTPSKNCTSYQQDRAYPSQGPPKRHSPSKRSSGHYHREANGVPKSRHSTTESASVLHQTSRGQNKHPPASASNQSGFPKVSQQYDHKTRLPDKAKQRYMAYEKKNQQHRMANESDTLGYQPHHFDQENYQIDDPPDITNEDFGYAAPYHHAASGARGNNGHSSTRTGPPNMAHISAHPHQQTSAVQYNTQTNHSVRIPTMHHQVYESKQGLDSPLMSDGSVDGPLTIGDDSAHDNTFTGSLNKHEIGNESSDSYSSRPDTFQWLHQKYGTQAPVVTKPPESLSRTAARNDPIVRSIENIEDDEEDDIFFGLEEVHSDDSDAKRRKPKTILPVRVEADRLHVDDDPLDDIFKERLTEARKSVPVIQRETPIRKEHPNQIAKPASTVLQKAQTKLSEKIDESENSLPIEAVSDVEGHSVQMVHAGNSEKSVASDMSSSLMVDRGWKTRYRPNPVDTIIEEPHAPVSVNDEDATADEDSFRNDGKPPASMFKNFSTAFVKSIQQACKMPVKMPDLAACAVDTKMKCDEKISEAWVGLSEEEGVENEEEEVENEDDTATATVTVGQSDAGTVAEETLNDVERKIWAAWDNRDMNQSEIASETLHSANDVPRQTSDSSISNTSRSHRESRTDAQNKLLQHAEKAMELFGTNSEKFAALSTESSISQGPKPQADNETTSSRLSAALSFEQRAVLERFSSSLKNEGVPVLKLSRRNKWQRRYLTVSKEVTMLWPEQDSASRISQCPKGLLWPKRIIRGQSSTISSIMTNGRGGVPFEKLKHVHQVASNEYYDNNLPKTLKREFPIFAGVAIDYLFDGGQRQMHLCFKSKIDSQAFVTAMHIIREATERAVGGKGDRKLESCPTESSGTKSFEN